MTSPNPTGLDVSAEQMKAGRKAADSSLNTYQASEKDLRTIYLAMRSLEPTKVSEGVDTWRDLIDRLSALRSGEQCSGASCKLCLALLHLTFAFDEQDLAALSVHPTVSAK